MTLGFYMFSSLRMQREASTIEAMIRIYCRHHHHGKKTPCEECVKLLAYARKRLAKCPFQEKKTTCGKCPIHCYKPAMRERVRVVMRYAGPRMLFRHPFMAVLHSLDGLRKKPGKRL